ncbi:hypothetical protein F8S09_15660 [Deinococcus sp. SDU3-2]|uniref:DUF4139 domain-containing protein n=1 Tax=Deinococcus terrestris TaxID=2651870 RepID=A0A7X1NYF7_9DEIO|nr:DUF4139 domain-containing protein [Deinococcus terrestris]MPY68093.1 hypothetical protein [Deinococcus terrestris]
MKAHARRALLLTPLLFGMAGATDLRVYPGFSEVREGVTVQGQRLEITLAEGVWPGLLPGSLELRGLGLTGIVQDRAPGWLERFQGQTVKLRENGQSQPVTLVRASDLTIRDAAGDYRQVRLDQLAFPTLPPQEPLAGPRRLIFEVAQPGQGVFSYLTRSVTWSPRYILSAAGNNAGLNALADIRNTGTVPYTSRTTELFSGEANLARGQAGFGSAPVPVTTVTTGFFTDTEDAAAPPPTLNPAASLGGLYRYALDRPLTLPAGGTVTLPFLKTRLTTFERFAVLNTYFSPQSSRGALNRTYRLTADQPLPGGVLTVREEGRVVGQTTLLETEKGEKIEFTLGRDPEVRYGRVVKVLEPGERGSGRYQVTYTFENSKERPLRVELTERVYGRVALRINGVEKTGEARMELRVDVPARGSVTRSFTVEIEN